MRIITFFLIFIFTVNLNAQDKNKIAQFEKLFENAYKKNSNDELKKILNRWNLAFQSVDLDNLNNPAEKSIYELYKIFYKPKDLLKLGNWEWENKLNENSEFVIIQSKISYSILDLESLKNINENKRGNVLKKDSIINFRPQIDFDKSKILYSNINYNLALTKFLGSQSTKFGKPNIMSVSRPKKESEKRYKFIRPFIPVLHGHWGGYWQILTNPTIYALDFNRELTEAKIYFQVGYEGGETYLIKENQNWTIKESKTTWIE